MGEGRDSSWSGEEVKKKWGGNIQGIERKCSSGVRGKSGNNLEGTKPPGKKSHSLLFLLAVAAGRGTICP